MSSEIPSVEAGVRQLVDERIAEIALEEDNFAWAKSYVDEGLAALERGDVITLEEHKARTAARLAALKS
jgi:antitoxin ParD1/3/4